MLHEISIKELKLNPMSLFGEEWPLLVSGSEETGFNAMTIAWGNLGTLWERKSHSNRLPVATCFVRPGRYTKSLMDRTEYFSICVLSDRYKKLKGYFGSKSGKDEDKLQKSGLTFTRTKDTLYIDQSSTVFICRKLYHAPLVEEGFVDRELIDYNYPQKDFHEMYTGEIVQVLADGNDAITNGIIS